jgi:hypothetical protein
MCLQPYPPPPPPPSPSKQLAVFPTGNTIEMNITGTLSSDKLPIFFLNPNLDPQALVSGGQNRRAYIMID